MFSFFKKESRKSVNGDTFLPVTGKEEIMKPCKASRYYALFLLLLTAGLIATAFQSCTMEEGPARGSLRLHLSQTESRSIGPLIPVEPVFFAISGNGPGESTFQLDGSSREVIVENLFTGPWAITVEGFDQGGNVTATGSREVVIEEEELACTITLYPVEGEGTLDLLIQWDETQIAEPSLSLELTNEEDVSVDISGDITPGDGEASYSTTLASGFHTVAIRLFDGADHVGGAVEVIRIYAGKVSSGTIQLPVAPETGTGHFIITPEMRGTLEGVIEPPPGPLFTDGFYTLTWNSSAGADPDPAVAGMWFRNGLEIGTGKELTVFPREGSQRYDITVKNGDTGEMGNSFIHIEGIEPVRRGGFTAMERLPSLAKPGPAMGGIRSLAISPDGTTLFGGAYDSNRIGIFLRDTGTGLLSPGGEVSDNGGLPFSGVTDLRFLDDTRAIAASKSAGCLHLIEAAGAGWQSTLTFGPADGMVNPESLALHSSGLLFCADTGADTIFMYDADSQPPQLLGTFSNGVDDVTELSLAGDELFAASFTGDWVKRFSIDPGTGALALIESLPVGVNGPSGMAIRDGKLYLGDYYGKSLHILEVPAGSSASLLVTLVQSQLAPVEGEGLKALAVSPDGGSLVACDSAGDSLGFFYRDGTTGLVSPTAAFLDEESLYVELDGPRELLFSPDGRDLYIAAGNSGKLNHFRKR